MHGSRHAVNMRHLDMSNRVSTMAGSGHVALLGNKANIGTVRDTHLAMYMQPLEKLMPSGQSSPIFMVALVEM